MIMRAKSGRSIVSTARCDCRFMESFHGYAVMGHKGDMGSGLMDVPRSDPEECLWTDAISRKSGAFSVKPRDPERSQRPVVEPLRLLNVANADGYVIQHAVNFSPAGARCVPGAA